MTPVTRHNMSLEDAIKSLESYYTRIPEIGMQLKRELPREEFEKVFFRLRNERRMVKAKLDDLYIEYVVSLRISKMMRNRMEWDVNCC